MKDILEKLRTSRGFLYGNAILLFVLLNVLGARSSCRLDLSRNQVNSLTSSSERVLSRLKTRVLLEAYISQDMPGEVLAQLQPVITQLQELDRAGGDKIQYRLINPDTEEKRKQAARRGVRGHSMEAGENIAKSTLHLAYFGVYMRVGEKSRVISLLETDPARRREGRYIIENFEYLLLRELKKISRTREIADIGFVSGPGLIRNAQPRTREELSKDSLSFYRYILEEDHGRLKDVSLASPVPEGIRLLLIVGMPAFKEAEVYHLDQFLMRGGSVLMMLKGFDFRLPRPRDRRMARFNMGGGGRALRMVKETEKLNSWLGRYGILLRPEILLEYPYHARTFDLEFKYLDAYRNPTWAVYTRDKNQITDSHPLLQELQAVIFPWFSGLDLREAVQPDVKFRVLVKSSPQATSREALTLSALSLHNLRRGPADRPAPHPYPVAVLAEGRFMSLYGGKNGGKNPPPGTNALGFRALASAASPGRLAVIGTPYLVSDILFKRMDNSYVFRYNQIFLTNLVEAMRGEDDLRAARSRTRVPALIPGVEPGFKTLFKWFHILFLPVILAIFGSLRLIKRNRRLGLETVIAQSAEGENPENEDAATAKTVKTKTKKTKANETEGES